MEINRGKKDGGELMEERFRETDGIEITVKGERRESSGSGR